MKVTLDLKFGSNHSDYGTREDMQQNIDALMRVLEGNRKVCDDNYILDTVSILLGIASQLPSIQNTRNNKQGITKV
jgi:hypothetical protein